LFGDVKSRTLKRTNMPTIVTKEQKPRKDAKTAVRGTTAVLKKRGELGVVGKKKKHGTMQGGGNGLLCCGYLKERKKTEE